MKKWNQSILGQDAVAAQTAKTLMKECGTIYAVAGCHMEKATAFTNAYTVEHCYDIKDLFADEQVDIIYITTPHTYCYDYMICALRYGKHVLCEKAVTVNHGQPQEVMALVQEKQLILMEAMTILHMPAFVKAKELVEQDAIGKLRIIQVDFGGCREYDVTNRFFSPQLAGETLLDIDTYVLSFVCWFLYAQPDTIPTNVIPFETGVDEMSDVILRNSLDEMATVMLTMQIKLLKVNIVAGGEECLEIRGYPRANSLQIRYTGSGWAETLGVGTRSDALIYELRDMEVAVNVTASNSTLRLSSDVVTLMNGVRRQWGICYPSEGERVQAPEKRCI